MSYLIHTKHYRDTNGNTYSASECWNNHELALTIPKRYGAPESQQTAIRALLAERLGLKPVMSWSDLERFTGTVYRVIERTTATEVKNWGND